MSRHESVRERRITFTPAPEALRVGERLKPNAQVRRLPTSRLTIDDDTMPGELVVAARSVTRTKEE
jgi:hypothetical protein